jgi:dTDP-4-dehydrorhamnose 3,5-epimerase
MFEIVQSKIKGCFEIVFKNLPDNRGIFTKTFHINAFQALGIEFKFAEEYFSFSRKNVFRGMHFQVPPHEVDKIIYCPHGAITDYVIDLRSASSTYGSWASFELNAETPKAVFVPKGLAHGFYVKSDLAVVQCKSSGVFDGPSDKTISYRSFSFSRDVIDPVLSEKDISAELFENFKSPF